MNVEDAFNHYTTVNGGQLTRTSRFGEDPLEGYPEKQARRVDEILKKCSFESIFSRVQQGHFAEFSYCIQLFLTISYAL